MSGKGSNRRNEDTDKVRSNWDQIDWSSTRKEEKKEQDELPEQTKNTDQ